MSEKILPLRQEEVKSLLETAQESGPRDELIVRLLLGTGMRIGELCPLTPGDIDIKRGAVTLSKCVTNHSLLGNKATHNADQDKHWVFDKKTGRKKKSSDRPAYDPGRELVILGTTSDRKSLTGERTRGKPAELFKKFPHGELVKEGLKASQPTRIVPLSDRTALVLLADWTQGIPGNQFLWLSQKGGRLTYKALFDIIVGLMKKAMIPEAKCHPHQLRHTFAVAYLKKTRDLARLQRTLGHTDIGTTTIYLRFAYDDLKEALDRAGNLYE